MPLYTQTNPNPRSVRLREPTRPKHTPLRRNPSGSFHGGTCRGCGRALTTWYTYQMCDPCLVNGCRVNAQTYTN